MGKRESTGRARRDPELEQRWRGHVEAWRARDVAAKVYCEEHGLSVHSLYAWSRRLAARSAGASADTTSPRFVAVDVRREEAPVPGGTSIEIAPDGTIRVPAELDVERLAAVLEVARRSAAC